LERRPPAGIARERETSARSRGSPTRRTVPPR